MYELSGRNDSVQENYLEVQRKKTDFIFRRLRSCMGSFYAIEALCARQQYILVFLLARTILMSNGTFLSTTTSMHGVWCFREV